MNPRTKPGERISEAPKENPAAAFRNAAGKSEPERAGCKSAREEFLGMKFVNGTLVQWATMFSEPLIRGRITEFSVEDGRLKIRAEGPGNFFFCDLSLFDIVKRGGVFYLGGPSCPNPCAVAPEGVEIPIGSIAEILARPEAPAACDDGIAESKRLLQAGMPRKSAERGDERAFRDTDFMGGTAVVYTEGWGFSLEEYRGTVTSFRIDGNEMRAMCEEEARLRIDDLRYAKIEKSGGVFLISVDDTCIAFAPRGVAIPKKMTLDEAQEDAKQVLAGRRE